MDERIILDVQTLEGGLFRPLELQSLEVPPPTLLSTGKVERIESISLIIPTFFNTALKRRSLEHVLDGIDRSQCIEEVIVAVSDGEPTDYEFVKNLPGRKRLQLICCEPHNRARSRNVPAAAATGKFLLFLDDDMLMKDWRAVDVILSEMLAGNYDCALFPRRNYIRFPVLFDPVKLRETISLWRAAAECPDSRCLYDPVRQGCRYKSMCFCFPGCFMLIGRETFAELGGFSEDFQGWGFEDADLAMRACREFRVLNLFRRSEALLHIDHPVSPYKSEEYHANHRRFSKNFSLADLAAFYSRVLGGGNFERGERLQADDHLYLAPLRVVQDAFHVPLDSSKLAQAYLRVVRQRQIEGFDPLPEYIILHGSRGRDKAGPGSDFDILILFRDGVLHEFFAWQTSGVRVELEFSDLSRFEMIAERCSHYTASGPLELAKIAQGMLLWGNRGHWKAWSQKFLLDGSVNGRCFWLLYALGLELLPDKMDAVLRQFIVSLRTVLTKGDAGAFASDIAQLDAFALEPFGTHTAEVLDTLFPDWRSETEAGEKIVPNQTPEVWIALQWLLENR